MRTSRMALARYTATLSKTRGGFLRFLRAGLRSGFVDQLLPNALRFENELDDFARGTLATGGFRSIIRRAPHFESRVGDGDGKANAAHDGQVRQVVAEKRDLGLLRAGFAQNIFVSRDFVPLLFVNKFNVQLLAPAPQSRAASPGDDAGAQACRHRERKALAVVCVERLDF